MDLYLNIALTMASVMFIYIHGKKWNETKFDKVMTVVWSGLLVNDVLLLARHFSLF